jgi:hypothetical protein
MGLALADAQPLADIARHLTFALFRCVRKLRQDSVPTHREIDELAAYIMSSSSLHQSAGDGGEALDRPQGGRASNQLLVDKAEAAERLGRFRVGDLESCVADRGHEADGTRHWSIQDRRLDRSRWAGSSRSPPSDHPPIPTDPHLSPPGSARFRQRPATCHRCATIQRVFACTR